MAWYWIVLIVLFTLLCLLFLAYMTNADMKLIEKYTMPLLNTTTARTSRKRSDLIFKTA